MFSEKNWSKQKGSYGHEEFNFDNCVGKILPEQQKKLRSVY